MHQCIALKSQILIVQSSSGQLPHLAPTYAAVLSLCLIESDEALEAIDMKGIKDFLWSVRESNGAFRMHVDGELDVRGAYCAVTVARLSGISPNNKLFEGTAEWIAECQTYEGGFGGAPGKYLFFINFVRNLNKMFLMKVLKPMVGTASVVVSLKLALFDRSFNLVF